MSCVGKADASVVPIWGSFDVMASEVEKFISAALLNEKSYGRWNYTELETDCPELVNSVRHHLGAEGAKPSRSRREDVQETRVSGVWLKLTDGGVKRPHCSKEVSPIPLHGFSKLKANYLERKPLADMTECSTDGWCQAGGQQKFKKDIAKHNVLTTNVLDIGETLLQCMSSNAPVLKDALGMIAKQPEELERHADQLYASVIAAMDAIADGNLVGSSEAQQARGKELESSLMLPLEAIECRNKFGSVKDGIQLKSSRDFNWF